MLWRLLPSRASMQMAEQPEALVVAVVIDAEQQAIAVAVFAATKLSIEVQSVT